MDEESSVEGLKDKLYSRARKESMQDVRSPLTRAESDVPVSWEGGMPPREKRVVERTPADRISFATKFFIVSVGFFFVALAVAAVAFWWGPNTISPNNISIEIVGPSLTDGGKEADFQILIDNRNPSQLELADLVLDYP